MSRLSDRIWLSQDGKMVSSDESDAEEYVRVGLLKGASLKVKPLKWIRKGFGLAAKDYEIIGRDKFVVSFKGKSVSPEFKSEISACAYAQNHHEKEILSCLDLGAWKEQK